MLHAKFQDHRTAGSGEDFFLLFTILCGQPLVVHTSDFGPRGRGFEPHSGRRLVSLSKKCLPPPPPPSSNGNTRETVALSQHD